MYVAVLMLVQLVCFIRNLLIAPRARPQPTASLTPHVVPVRSRLVIAAAAAARCPATAVAGAAWLAHFFRGQPGHATIDQLEWKARLRPLTPALPAVTANTADQSFTCLKHEWGLLEVGHVKRPSCKSARHLRQTSKDPISPDTLQLSLIQRGARARRTPPNLPLRTLLLIRDYPHSVHLRRLCRAPTRTLRAAHACAEATGTLLRAAVGVGSGSAGDSGDEIDGWRYNRYLRTGLHICLDMIIKCFSI